jgi:hypothetical protein
VVSACGLPGFFPGNECHFEAFGGIVKKDVPHINMFPVNRPGLRKNPDKIIFAPQNHGAGQLIAQFRITSTGVHRQR